MFYIFVEHTSYVLSASQNALSSSVRSARNKDSFAAQLIGNDVHTKRSTMRNTTWNQKDMCDRRGHALRECVILKTQKVATVNYLYVNTKCLLKHNVQCGLQHTNLNLLIKITINII